MTWIVSPAMYRYLLISLINFSCLYKLSSALQLSFRQLSQNNRERARFPSIFLERHDSSTGGAFSVLVLLFNHNKVGSDDADIDWDALLPMDVVLYTPSLSANKSFRETRGDPVDTHTNMGTTGPDQVYVGAMQEDGQLVPLSVWKTEPVFDSYLEFLLDDEDLYGSHGSETLPTPTSCRIVSFVPPDAISYGSRQVGGGKGPGNPHGEESERLYYVDQSVLPSNVRLLVKPHLEITW
jgi:hypothetical protein